MYEVRIKKKVLKGLPKLPKSVQMNLVNLLEDLRDKGPLRTEWPNFSSLGSDRYHCHIEYKWVACGTWEKTPCSLRSIMQAVVKTPLIEIKIKGEIPAKMLSFHKKEYGTQLKLVGKSSDSENPFDSDWYKQIRKEVTPGGNLKIYREMHSLSQTDLGQKLVLRQHNPYVRKNACT